MTTPAAIATMFEATNRADTAGFLACFTDDAFLHYWGRDFTGRDGVARWNQTDVRVRGQGFNGEGDMAFTLRDGKIARLVIA